MELTKPSRTVKSVQQAFEIVDFIHDQNGAELSEIADHLDLAKSTVHGYLATLEYLDYLVRDGNSYRLSMKFLYHGKAAQNSVPLSRLSEGLLEHLSSETGLNAWLIVEEHGIAVYVRKAMTTEEMPTYGRVSKRTPLHVIAGGQAILASLSESRVRDIVESYGLPAKTEYTITDEARLFSTLETIRERGYAVSEHEAALGMKSIAAPVCHEGTVLGAFSVSGYVNHLDDDHFFDEVPDIVQTAAAELEDRYQQYRS